MLCDIGVVSCGLNMQVSILVQKATVIDRFMSKTTHIAVNRYNTPPHTTFTKGKIRQ